MRPVSSWSPEVQGLLESFEPLRGLVARTPSGTGDRMEERLAALFPEQVGLSSNALGSRDWELFLGGMLYAANALKEAHSLFQEVHSAEGAYWHGILHRREGDFSNALYWIRRAGRIPALAGMAEFSPEIFIQECAAAAVRGAEPLHLLETQRLEWEGLMLWSWRRLKALG